VARAQFGTSANALHIQIWTALIALLLLTYLQLKATFAYSTPFQSRGVGRHESLRLP
jgi:hypothetical protein